MPLLNYTTQVDANKTIAQIQAVLVLHGARAILTEYAKGNIVALSFKIETPSGELGFRLPVDAAAVLRVLLQQNVAPRFQTPEQAARIAWRIVKDWVEAQMAIIDTEMVKMEQVFLPYLITPEGKTLYERVVEGKFLLGEGK